MEVFRTSVRTMVEFLFRNGSLDNRSGGNQKQAMDAGSRIHRKIQRQMGSQYEAEVSLKYTVDCGDFDMRIEGRADGIFTKEYEDDELNPGAENHMLSGNFVFIDEIKGVYKDVNRLENPIWVHQAQAMCYAAIYGIQENQTFMGVQMTYCNLESEEIKRFQMVYTIEELTEWFEKVTKDYSVWAGFYVHQQQAMRESLRGLAFPFPYRPGQRKLAVTVYRSIEQSGELFIQAPTGIGKTMSVLFPALQAMGQGMADRAFYLTAKTVVRTVAEEAFDILRGKGLKIHSVTITAKEKICANEVCECNPEACPYANGHFDRVNDALYDALTHESALKRESILAYAEKHQVCPFEFSLDLTLWSQGIICDYNYVFDPTVYLRRFFGENVSGRYLFLVDEAHNLPDRAREMYSARLVKEEVLEMQRLMKTLADIATKDEPDALRAAGKTAGALGRCNKELLALKKETDGILMLDFQQLDQVYERSLQIQEQISAFLEETRNPVPDELLDFYFELRHFNSMCELVDEHYLVYGAVEGSHFVLHLLCANPAQNLSNCVARAVSTVYFSATMLPMQYYKELLTTNEEAYAIYVDSPFEQKNRLLGIAEDVSSRYTMRGPIQYGRVLHYICEMATGRKGNYMVFFPSYQYMMEVAALAEEMEDSGNLPFRFLVQEQGMDETSRLDFLAAFGDGEEGLKSEAVDSQAQVTSDQAASPKASKSLVGFCVIGGIFSEGIDLVGEKLIGAIVVGTGLAQRNQESDLLMEYFSEMGKKGYDYAYRYPGMNKVFQAAGRVIRSREDQGIILLLDNRMTGEDHVRLFPMDWADYEILNQYGAGGRIRKFWDTVDGD